MYRLATLRPDEQGIVDIYRQTTYAGGAIPRDHQGDLMIRTVSGETQRHPTDLRLEYESVCLRISGSFDD